MQVGLFADGAAVRTTGSETFRVASQYVDDMITVTTDEICQASVCGGAGGVLDAKEVKKTSCGVVDHR